jgi:catechol 2,3-dioxygenase-like lactoylglutathione lyase family enzyme
MISKSSVIAFVATRQPKRAKAFYQRVLGLKLLYEDPFAIVFHANGTMLRVQKVNEHTVLPYTALGWDVADLRSELKRLSRKKVKALRFEHMTQDGLGVWVTPSGAKLAWFKDPDGNILSLTQFK